MDKIEKNEVKKVYEIGYLLISSVPVEKVQDVVVSLKDVLSKKGASIIGEESPELIPLAYTMVKKIGSMNHKFDQAYFGWVKFELGVGEIEDVKKSFETHPDMLRMLLITTVKENTYLGKKSLLGATVETANEIVAESPVVNETLPLPDVVEKSIVSIDEVDKSIDEMVKGA